MIIIQDTREQNGWDFDFYGYPTVRGTLKEGDYTVKELMEIEAQTSRKILRIERKASTGEISYNLGRGWRQFMNEIRRLKEYEHKFIICEFNLDLLMQFPWGSTIPESRWYKKNKQGKRVKNIKMSGKFMLSRLEEIEENEGVPVVFCDGKPEAMQKAYDIFNKVYNAVKEEV